LIEGKYIGSIPAPITINNLFMQKLEWYLTSDDGTSTIETRWNGTPWGNPRVLVMLIRWWHRTFRVGRQATGL